MKKVKSLFKSQVPLSTLFCLLLTPVHSIETSGDFLVTNTCYRNAVGLSAPNIEFMNMNALQCRRQCAVRESCKACHIFTHSVTQYQVCHLYQDNICDYNNVTMYYDSNVTDGSIWEKISGNEVNNVFTCRSDGNCVVSPEIPTTTAPSFSFSTSLGTSDAAWDATVGIPNESATNAGTTFNNETSPPLTTINSANPATTEKPVETRPRTCWDYYVLNGTLDSGYGTPRPIWPSGFANGTNITVYCKLGYTAILINYAVISGIYYANQNDVTVFGSLKQRIAITNTAAWNAYASSINFAILSSLVRISNRTLYYENVDDFPSSCTYTGFDITPDGTLSIQGSRQTISGNPPNFSGLPLINSSFIANSTCGPFWKLHTISTDNCNQETNMLLPTYWQKTGLDYTNLQYYKRFVALAFK